MLENGLEKCSCKKKKCERHGKCTECIEFHKTNKYEPYCKRKKIMQGLFDKSEK
ncbi:MAG: hypothetical protein Q8900_02355 [Bacillota bacterium]|nr:hypothetical protein [Bacillota bacterium]